MAISSCSPRMPATSTRPARRTARRSSSGCRRRCRSRTTSACRGAACARRALHAAHLQQPVAARLRLDEAEDSGITRMGREVIEEMNRLGMVIDMSHAGERTTLEAIDLSARPIAVTHANPAWWCPMPRGKSRPVLKALAARGGMLGLSLYPHHLEARFADCTLESFMPHGGASCGCDRVANLGIGSDLCQDQPDSVVRDGCGKAAGPGRGRCAAAFPPQPSWFPRQSRFRQGRRRACAGPASGRKRDRHVLGENWYRFCATAFAPAPALHRSPVAAAAATGISYPWPPPVSWR